MARFFSFSPVNMLYALIPVLYKCFKINKKLEKKSFKFFIYIVLFLVEAQDFGEYNTWMPYYVTVVTIYSWSTA